MKLQSLAWRTDLALVSREVSVCARQDYLVVTSNAYPNHIWKNFILFRTIPEQGRLDELVDIHRFEFGHALHGRTIAFGWDVDCEGSILNAAFERTNFRLERLDELVCSGVHQWPTTKCDLSVRPVRCEADWRRVVSRRIEIFSTGRYRDLQAQYETEKFENYRCLASAGCGDWYIASVDGTEVGDMGLFVVADSIGRFQEVLIYPRYQNVGFGKQMTAQVCRLVTAEKAPKCFVAVCDKDGPARSVYGSIGFRKSQTQAMAHWNIYPKRLSGLLR